TWDGSGSGQAAALFTGSSDVATVRDYRIAGQPAQPGDHLSIRVTGLASPDSPAAIQPIVRLGGVSAAVDSVKAIPGLSGVYEVQLTVPAAAPFGDAIPVLMQLLQPDGKLIESNQPTITI